MFERRLKSGGRNQGFAEILRIKAVIVKNIQRRYLAECSPAWAKYSHRGVGPVGGVGEQDGVGRGRGSAEEGGGAGVRRRHGGRRTHAALINTGM